MNFVFTFQTIKPIGLFAARFVYDLCNQNNWHSDQCEHEKKSENHHVEILLSIYLNPL